MFKIFKQTPKTPVDEKMEQIKNILFPPLDLKEKIDDNGETIKFHIDYSVDSNLDAALMDLQEGHNDPIVQSTISKVIDRLNKVRRIMEAYAELDKDAKYLIVDDLGDDTDVEAGPEGQY